MDTVPPDVRSRIMSRIRGRDTKPERIVRSVAHQLGLRFRLCVRALPGSPDLVFRKHRTVLFVHGCFWHSHECREGRAPKTRPDYWEAKFAATRARDAKHKQELTKAGWRVLEVWECQTQDLEGLKRMLSKAFATSSPVEPKPARRATSQTPEGRETKRLRRPHREGAPRPSLQ